MTQEEANRYWAERDYKKWVVTLQGRKKLSRVVEFRGRQILRRLPSTHDMYVGARSREGAIACALRNAPATNTWTLAGVRLARPYDLGCVRVEEPAPRAHETNVATRPTRRQPSQPGPAIGQQSLFGAEVAC